MRPVPPVAFCGLSCRRGGRGRCLRREAAAHAPQADPISVAGHCGKHFRSGLGGHQARNLLWDQCAAGTPAAENLQSHEVCHPCALGGGGAGSMGAKPTQVPLLGTDGMGLALSGLEPLSVGFNWLKTEDSHKAAHASEGHSPQDFVSALGARLPAVPCPASALPQHFWFFR